ncbi:MAG TPA: S-methyl-5'-thioadenosine phosphorylase [Polyangiales bacterium]
MSKHHIGILGGSGLYAMPGLEDVREVPVRTPFGDPSDAIVTGSLGDTRFYFLPRHGRGHRLAPHRVNYRANVFALKAQGAQQLVSISAVGSLQDHIHPGDLVVVDQYIDRTRGRASTFFDQDVVAHVSMALPTDAALSHCLAEVAEREGARLHRAGTYLCMEGPQFSTRAESLLHKSWKADVIGMTNLPEAKLAREAELPYASLCFVTDYDAWHDTEEAVTVDAVLAVLRQNVGLAQRVLRGVSGWPDPGTSPASSALANALITDPAFVPPTVRERLAPLIGKYLPLEAP